MEWTSTVYPLAIVAQSAKGIALLLLLFLLPPPWSATALVGWLAFGKLSFITTPSIKRLPPIPREWRERLRLRFGAKRRIEERVSFDRNVAVGKKRNSGAIDVVCASCVAWLPPLLFSVRIKIQNGKISARFHTCWRIPVKVWLDGRSPVDKRTKEECSFPPMLLLEKVFFVSPHTYAPTTASFEIQPACPTYTSSTIPPPRHNNTQLVAADAFLSHGNAGTQLKVGRRRIRTVFFNPVLPFFPLSSPPI